MPSATGENWEKYKKEFADDETPEKKITPLTDEYVHATSTASLLVAYTDAQGHSSAQNIWRSAVCSRIKTIREANKGETNQCQ